MTILEQKWEEEKINVNLIKFIRSNFTLAARETSSSTSFMDSIGSLKIPLLGTGGAAFLLLILVIAANSQ